MYKFTITAFLLIFSMLLLAGCTVHKPSHNRYKQSTKRYNRSCGCSVNQPDHIALAQLTFGYGK